MQTKNGIWQLVLTGKSHFWFYFWAEMPPGATFPPKFSFEIFVCEIMHKNSSKYLMTIAANNDRGAAAECLNSLKWCAKSNFVYGWRLNKMSQELAFTLIW